MTRWERFLDHLVVALLVVGALAVAFAACPGGTLRARFRRTADEWTWTARDATQVRTTATATVRTVSSRETALRLLADVLGDL